MDFNNYQKQAMGFRLPSATGAYALLNLPGEVGELCSLQAKAIRDGVSPGHSQNVKKELGDVLWHVAAIAEDNGFTLQEIAEGNLTKLSSRKARDVIAGSGDDR